MSNSDELIYEVKDRIATMTINRPQARNSLSASVLSGLNSGLDQAAADDKIGAIVITGAGGKAFCSGADLAGSFSGDASWVSPAQTAPSSFAKSLSFSLLAKTNISDEGYLCRAIFKTRCAEAPNPVRPRL